jgi:eukaryotic-like serine/threonine-protein kinase
VFEIDGALAAVRGAIDAGLLDLLWMDLCPVLDPVRKDARFPPLREEVAVRVQAVRAAMREA